jgi:elongation factor P
MIDANELRKGTTFLLDGELFEVLEYQHYKPGRGNAIIRTKIRNMRSGSIIPKNFLDGHRFEEAPVERLTSQYLYNDGEYFHFMESDTYEQHRIHRDRIAQRAGYLKDGMEVALTLYGSEVLGIDLPATVELEVVDAEMAVVGDTATGATKNITCGTGLKVQVPMFINVGDVIRVDTVEGKYQTRV